MSVSIRKTKKVASEKETDTDCKEKLGIDYSRGYGKQLGGRNTEMSEEEKVEEARQRATLSNLISFENQEGKKEGKREC